MKKYILFAFVILIALVVVVVLKNLPPRASTEPIKIGVIVPLTGDLSSIGVPDKAALEIATKEINDKGGINGRKVSLVIEDTKCLPSAGVAASQKLIHINKVSVILGEVCSGVTLSVAPLANKTKTPLISFCSSAPNITDAGDYVFRTYPSDAFEAKQAAGFAKNSLHTSTVAILYINNPFGIGQYGVFKDAFQKLGGSIVAEELYPQGTTDMRTQLTKIKATNPDLVFYPGYTDDSIYALRQIKELDIATPLLGANTWEDAQIPKEAQDAAEGIMWSYRKTPQSPSFFTKAMKARGQEIAYCTMEAYDTMKLMEKVLKTAPSLKGEDIKNTLYGTTLSGLSGPIAFDKNGDLKNAAYVIKQIKNGKVIISK